MPKKESDWFGEQTSPGRERTARPAQAVGGSDAEPAESVDGGGVRETLQKGRALRERQRPPDRVGGGGGAPEWEERVSGA